MSLFSEFWNERRIYNKIGLLTQKLIVFLHCLCKSHEESKTRISSLKAPYYYFALAESHSVELLLSA